MKLQLILGAMISLSLTTRAQFLQNGADLYNNPLSGWVGVGTMNPQTKFQVADGNLAHVNIFSMSSNAAKLSLSNSFLTYYYKSDQAVGNLGVQTSGGDYNLLNFQKSSTYNTQQVWIGNVRPQGVHADF